MRILLDTHILIWCLQSSENLPVAAHDLIMSADEVYASAANIWEIIIKMAIGKLTLPLNHNDLLAAIEASGFSILSIKPEHALKLMDVQNLHRDPFDRILIAQSLNEPMHLLTCDSMVANYGGNVIKV